MKYKPKFNLVTVTFAIVAGLSIYLKNPFFIMGHIIGQLALGIQQEWDERNNKTK
jgi:hypothetical protein